VWSGVVLQRAFREGSEAQAGQALYQLTLAPYRAAFESAQATVVKAQATLAQATAQVERNKALVEANAISKQEFTTLQTTQRQAEADLGVAKAAVETARINLAYATITAPISGRIGQSAVTEGALVGAADATALATIQQTGSVHVNFTQSSTEVLRLRKAIASKQLRASGDGSVPVRIVLEDGSELPEGRQVAVQRPDGGRHQRSDHPARRSAQRRRPVAARPVRARALVPGRAALRHHDSAASGDPRPTRATPCWWSARAASPARAP